jgi:DNA repair protein RadC
VLAQVSDDELIQRLLGRKVDGCLAALLELDRDGLSQAGLSLEETSTVLVVAEISRRHQPADESLPRITDPRAAVSQLGELRRSTTARMIMLLLDRGRRLRGTIWTGEAVVSASCPTVAPQAVASLASDAGASSAILAHNHLHGDSAPTAADVVFTRAVRKACAESGVELTDHLVVTPRGWVSLRKERLLD